MEVIPSYWTLDCYVISIKQLSNKNDIISITKKASAYNIKSSSTIY